uniref:Ig-like domain-containing protein n=1 Tax=Xiphophorus maculatus TaxID=8083 RepID=A0A3B5R373_XIPMA
YVCSGADGSTVILQQEGPRLFLTARVSSDALVVTQSPDVSVQEGETGSITCCWNGTAERVGIKWLKNQTLIENKTVINQTTGSKNEQKNKCSVLIIENMTTGDSGKYICKVSVEIPRLDVVEGKGTTITVTARENITKSTLEGLCNVTSNLQRSSCVFGLFAVIL